MALEANKKTLTWDEVYNAWTSFHAYTPEWMERLGNKMYSFKNGEMYEHDANEERGSFYGTSYGCSVTFSSNQEPSTVKMFKNLSLETNSSSWYADIDSELESGLIGNNSSYKFEDKEGIKYAYIRRNETDKLDFNKLSILGIGNLQSTPGSNQYTFSGYIPNQVSKSGTDNQGGDELYFNDGSSKLIGVIQEITDKTITTVASANVPATNDFCFVVKNASAESYGVRGYHAKITLTNMSTSFVELFSATTEVFKSNM